MFTILLLKCEKLHMQKLPLLQYCRPISELVLFHLQVKNKLDQREYAIKKIRLKQKHPESARKVSLIL